MKNFSIQIASQLSGVASSTIRMWEKRYQTVVPGRDENQHRLYTESDIVKLTLLARLTEAGEAIGKIAQLGVEELKELHEIILKRPFNEREVVASPDRQDVCRQILSGLFLALENYKFEVISHELEKASEQLNPRELCLFVIVPLFHEIGQKVSRGELTISHEHILSSLTGFYTGQMLGRAYRRVLHREEMVLITTPEGDLHQIGILAGALLCLHYGIRFIFMGPNLPAHCLAESTRSLKASAILLGVNYPELLGGKTLKGYLDELLVRLPNDTRIWLGGNVGDSVQGRSDLERFQLFSTLAAFDEYLANL